MTYRNPIRIIAALGPKIAAPIKSEGGTTEFDLPVCAGLCSGLHERAYWAAKLKWGADWSRANWLEYALWIEAAGLAARNHWKVPRGKELIRKLAGLAIAETGSPRHFRAETVKIAYVGLDSRNWYRRWRHRYEQVYEIFNNWASDGYRHINDAQEPENGS